MRSLYKRYEKRADPEALFTKFLDVVQATEVAADQFYDFKRKGRPDLEQQYREHIAGTMNGNIAIVNALGQFLSPNAQLELYDASTEAFAHYSRIGYQDEVDIAMQGLTIQRPVVREAVQMSA